MPAKPHGEPVIVIDVVELQRVAERQDAGPMAVVSRRWLGDVLQALTDPDKVKLLNTRNAPAASASA